MLEWSTIPDPSVELDSPEFSPLPPGRHLTIIRRITSAPVTFERHGKKHRAVVFNFEEVPPNLTRTRRETALFVHLDDENQPTRDWKGYGQWNLILDGLKIDRTAESFSLGKLILEPAVVIVSERGFIRLIEKPSRSEEDLALAFCEKYQLS